MAKINLRAYHEEIESSINRGRYDEAVSHCRNILRTYPKSVNTYRLLGKAFLEAKRYTDAIDIFQRVLSAIPDDFVSNLGLSIIREDEGNLDAAIWHMDRAYEIQPFNSAIQEELRRLYERRDGSAPPRIRLTRAALARMYAKGNLYLQASAEIRTILAKDPQRLDLQLLLANMYLKSGKKVEAAEISSKVLQKLPYCLEANRILVRVLSLSDRKDEIQPYIERLTALDPYEAFTSDDQPQVEIVPDSSVQVEKLDVQSDELMVAGEQADWMATLGLGAAELDTQLDEELPDWLVAASEQIQPEETQEAAQDEAPAEAEEFSNVLFSDTGADIDSVEWLGSVDAPTIDEEFPDTSTESEAIEDELPEWMEDAGWKAEQETQADIEPSDEIEVAEEGEIPDWLKSLAPEGTEESSTEIDNQMAALFEESAEDTAQEKPGKEPHDESTGKDNLTGIAGAAAGMAVAGAIFGREDEETAAIDETFAEITGDTLAPEEPSAAEDETELPEWLNEYDTEAETGPDISLGAAGAALASELPDWLKEVEESELPAGDVLESAPIDLDLSEVEIDGEELQKLEDSSVLGDLEESADSAISAKDVPDWVEDEQGPMSGETVSEIDVDLPDWLAEVDTTDAIEETADIKTSGAEIPEWLEDVENGVEVEETAETSEIESEVPEWLVEFEGEAPEESDIETGWVDENAGQAQAEATPTEDIPEWLKELQAEDEASVESSVEFEASDADLELQGQPSEEVRAEDEIIEEVPDFANGDEAMAWLAGLAGIQTDKEAPIDEETPIENIEKIEEVQEIEDLEVQEEPTLEQPDKAEIELESPPDFEDADSALAWLEGLAALQGIEEENGSVDLEMDVSNPETAAIFEEAELPLEPEEVVQQVPSEEIQEESQIQSTDEAVEKLDLNAASLVEIERLPGVGYRIAQSIVAYRESSGSFNSIEDLSNVPGIDPDDIFALQQYFYIEPQKTPPPEIEQKTDQGQINAARMAASAGDQEKAITIYSELIQAKSSLDEVIFDLNQAIHTRPEDYELWQLLGDAYMRNDQMIEAMQAYNKAEELLGY